MKTKKIILFALVAFLSCPVFSQSSMKDRTQNWTQESPMTKGKYGGSKETASVTPTTPVGSPAWALILGLGAVYGAYVFNRKRKAVK